MYGVEWCRSSEVQWYTDWKSASGGVVRLG